MKAYLPIGLTLAFIMVVFFPEITVPFSRESLVPWLVVIIFTISGYQMNLREVKFGWSFLLALSSVVLINLIIGPITGTAVATSLGLSSQLALGLIVMSAAPSTLSSGVVLTELAGGDIFWALTFTVCLSLIGIITNPFMLSICLNAEVLSISAIALLGKLIKIVLVPLSVGYLLRKTLKNRRVPVWARHAPSTCIILTVWLTLGTSRDSLINLNVLSIGLIVLCSLLVHGILFLLCVVTAKALNFSAYNRKAIIFVGSQKTLPVAVTVLACVDGEIGLAVVVCLIFHFTQLFLDSGIASLMGKRPKL